MSFGVGVRLRLWRAEKEGKGREEERCVGRVDGFIELLSMSISTVNIYSV